MNRSLAFYLGTFTSNRHLLIMTVVLILVAGVSALMNLPRIEDPRITTRNVMIITPFHGASATRVEALVTKKIEDRLRELSEIKTMESTSRRGISLIAVELQDWITKQDNEAVFSKIRDRLADADADLPAGAGTPRLDDKRGAVAYSMIVALSWKSRGHTNLGMINRHGTMLGDRLRNLPGTEQVVFFGAPSEEIQVNVDAAELAALGLTPARLAQQVAAADARGGAGTVQHANRDLQLELTGELNSTARIAGIPIGTHERGTLVFLGDIASVRKQWRDPPSQIALHNGERAILVALRTEDNIRLDQWASHARASVADFAAGIDPSIAVKTIFDQSTYTEQRLGKLAGNLLAGAAVIVLVIWFMMGWRPAFIVGSALPLSAGASLFGLTFLGEPIHQMTIFGMIIAIGLLIDNAIVMTDQVVQRRRAGDSPIEAVTGAVSHLFTPLFASTFTTILGFMPIFLLPGNVGDFVRPIAIAVVLALIASFALAMTVIPALAGLLAHVENQSGRRWWRDGFSHARLSSGYRLLLQGALQRPWTTLGLLSALPVAGFVMAGTLGMQFFPPADRDQIEIQVWMPNGSSIQHTTRRVRAMESVIRGHNGVKQVTWVTGASSPPVYYNQLRRQDNHPGYARGVVQVVGPKAAKDLEARLQVQLNQAFPDAQIVVKAFGQGPPVVAPVSFRIIGDDPRALRRLGEALREIMHRQPEILHTQASILGGEPKLWLNADEHRAHLAGLTLGDIISQFQTALNGLVGGRVLEDLEDLPVRIRYARHYRDSLEQVSTLRLASTRNEGWVPALALGELTLKPELAGITRRNGERVNHVYGFLRQGALPIEVSQAIQSELDQGSLAIPDGYRIETAGDSAEQQQAVSQLLTYAPVLATLMITTLVLSFRSFILAALIGLVAVFSVGMGMLSLWFGGYPLGFNPIIGSAGLIGVAINGSIVVIAAILANRNARSGIPEAIVFETLGATRHIISTTLTTMAGFMPLLLFTGGGFWPPLAIVIAGGVGLSALLSLVFTPTAYFLYTKYIKVSVVTEARAAYSIAFDQTPAPQKK